MDENHDTRLKDDFLQSLNGMKPAETNPFFYTRLKGRMQQRYEQKSLLYKPAWAIVSLAFFLTLNIWMIRQGGNLKQQTTENKSAAQDFADTYNLNSDSNY